MEEMTDSPRSLVEEVDGSGGTGSSSGALETERMNFSQSAPQFHNSKLLQQYEVSQKGHAGDKKTTTAASNSISTQNSAVKTTDRTAERMINGHHASVEKPVQNFQKGGSLDQDSAAAGAVTTGPKEMSSPQLSRSVTERGGKQSVDDGGSVCSSFNSSDSNYEVLEKQIQTPVG